MADRKKGQGAGPQEEDTYEVVGVTDPTNVPNWARQPKKWESIVKKIMELPPNKTLTLHFNDAAAAERARAAVRKEINSINQLAVLRTRKVDDAEGSGATVYFTRLSDEQARREQRG